MAQSPEDFLQTQQLLHKDSAGGGTAGCCGLLPCSVSLCVSLEGSGEGSGSSLRERVTPGCVTPAGAQAGRAGAAARQVTV